MTDVSKFLGAADASTEKKQAVLEAAGLISRDPSSYPNLSATLDPSVGLDSAFKPVAYDTRNSTGKMVKCSVCPQQQKHFDGAIVRLRDGKVGLVGNDCGRRHFFGENGWTAVSNRWRRESELALFRARFGNAKEVFQLIDSQIAEWGTAAKLFNTCRNRFRSRAPKLFQGIRKNIENGSLSRMEEHQVPYQDRHGETKTRTEYRQVSDCQINSEWFFAGDDIHAELVELRARLAKAVNLLNVDATQQNVTAVKRMLRDCRHDLEGCATRLSRTAPLKNPATISRMVFWADRTFNGKETYTYLPPLSVEVHDRDQTTVIDMSELPDKPQAKWEEINAAWPVL